MFDQSFSHMKLLRMEKQGGIASIVASCSTHPLHLLKVRMQPKGDSNPLLPSIPRLLCFCPRASLSARGHNRCIIRQEAMCSVPVRVQYINNIFFSTKNLTCIRELDEAVEQHDELTNIITFKMKGMFYSTTNSKENKKNNE